MVDGSGSSKTAFGFFKHQTDFTKSLSANLPVRLPRYRGERLYAFFGFAKRQRVGSSRPVIDMRLRHIHRKSSE